MPESTADKIHDLYQRWRSPADRKSKLNAILRTVYFSGLYDSYEIVMKKDPGALEAIDGLERRMKEFIENKPPTEIST